MAKRAFTSAALNFTASNAGTAATAFMALKGGNTTQVLDFLEIMISGKATASIVTAMELARSSTLGITPTALAAPHSDGPLLPTATALSSGPAVPYIAAATGPVPSNTVTDAKLNLALNVFGGIVRWNAAPTQQWNSVGNAVSVGESVLWNNLLAGGSTGLADAHILYEPY